LDFRSLTAVGLEQIEPALGEDDGDFSMAVKRKRPDEALLAEVPEITLPWVGRLAIVVEEIARRRDPKCANDAQRAGFRTTKRVLVVAIADELTFEPARQIHPLHEHVARIDGTVARVSIALLTISAVVPTRIIKHTNLQFRPASAFAPSQLRRTRKPDTTYAMRARTSPRLTTSGLSRRSAHQSAKADG
jgi:hypothetical protein